MVDTGVEIVNPQSKEPVQSQRPSNCISSSSCSVFVVLSELPFAFWVYIQNINLSHYFKQAYELLTHHKNLLDHFSQGKK